MKLLILTGLLALGTGCANLGLVRYAAIPPDGPQLAARADEIVANMGTTPGREFAGRLNTPKIQETIKALKGEVKVPRDEMPGRLWELRNAIRRYDQGQTWPVPALVKIPRAAKPPVIDGKLDDDAWAHAYTTSELYLYNQQTPSGQPTTFRLTWDDRYIYAAFDCTDTDLEAMQRPRDGQIYQDDCVEIYLLPVFRFRTFWEIEVSPKGCIYDSVQCKKIDSWGSIADTNQNVEGMQVGIAVDGTMNDASDRDGGYRIELAIPFDQLPGYTKLKPQVGDRLHFMLLRLDVDKTHKLKPYAHVPLLGWGHNIWNMGQMELTK